MTKAEDGMNKGIVAMIKTIVSTATNDGLSVQAVLKRVMSKLLGDRMLCKQETCHLILLLTMVSCSHNFQRIHLNNDLRQINA